MQRFFSLILFLLINLSLPACGGGANHTTWLHIYNDTDVAVTQTYVGWQGNVDTLGGIPPRDVISMVIGPNIAYGVSVKFANSANLTNDKEVQADIPGDHVDVRFSIIDIPGGGGPNPPPPGPGPQSILSVCNGHETSSIYQIWISVGSSDPDDAPSGPAWQAFYNGGGPSDPSGQIVPGAQNDQVVPLGDGFYSVWVYFANGEVDYIPAVELFNGFVDSVLGEAPHNGQFGPCVLALGDWVPAYGYPWYDVP